MRHSNALYIIADNDYAPILETTLPSFKQYAYRVGAELIIDSDTEFSIEESKLRKFRLYSLLGQYNRVLYLDSTTLISPQCPNLFNRVSANKLGVVFEDRNPSFIKNHGQIKAEAFNYYNVAFNDSRMFNAGVMVLSSIHQDLYDKPLKPLRKFDSFFSQTYENAMVSKLDYSIDELDYKYNYVGSLIREKALKQTTIKSSEVFILHATGGYNVNVDIRHQLLKFYYERWY